MITSDRSSTLHQRAGKARATSRLAASSLVRTAVIVVLALLLLPQRARADYTQDPDDDRNAFRIASWRFKSLDNPGADLRSLDAEAAGRLLRDALRGDAESVEGATEVFDRYSFEQLEALAKNPRVMSDAQKMGLAEARRKMIRRALEVSLNDFEVKTRQVGRFEIRALDSGNKGSGIASDVDQSVFLIDHTTGEVVSSAEIGEYIKQFDVTFESLYGHPPARFGIESMNGADFFPDHRLAHNLIEYAVEAKRVVEGKRPNLEAYRSEGELKSQAEGRGRSAMYEFGEKLVDLELAIEKARAEWDLHPKKNLTREQAQKGQEIINRLRAGEAAYTELIRLSPWTKVSRSADGKIVVSTNEDPRQTKVLPVEPEMVERFAFDGSYDNWFMFENHPHNRPKYLLRSGAEGPFLLSRLKRSTGKEFGPVDVVYDLTPGRKVTAYDYDTEYGRSNHTLNRQVLNDTYGHLEGRGSGLTVDRIQKAYDAAAKFRLRHKGALRPDGQPYDVYDVYSEYMSTDARYPEQIRLQEAMVRWEVDAREIMIENLMLTVRSPGEIMQGRFDAGEVARIAELIKAQVPDAPVRPEAFRLAAELQLYHGIHDLLSAEHARELLESDPIQKERIRKGRGTDLVDRLFAEAEKGAGGTKFRTELERIATEAAAVRVNASLNLEPHGRAEPTYMQELGAQMSARLDRLEGNVAAFESVRKRLREGGYTKEVVTELLLEGLTRAEVVGTRFTGEGVAHVLGAMGFEGTVVFPNGEVKLSNLKLEFGQPAFSGRKLLSNMFSAGSIYSGLIVLQTAIETDNDPSAVAWAAAREVILRLPYAMAGTALYDLVAHQRPEGASLVLTGYFSPGVAHGFILVSIGVMAVHIGGKVLLAPLGDDNADMIYQGYLAARKGGWVFDAGLAKAMQSPRDFLLSPVKIRAIPYHLTNATGAIVRRQPEQGFLTEREGDPVTVYTVAPYSFDEAKNLEFVTQPDVYEWATAEKLLGGEDPWEKQYRLANDQVNNPELHFKAKRASLFYHYENAVDEFLCRRGGFMEGFGPCLHDERTENIETLFTNSGFEGSAVALLPFFRDIVDDWIYRRDEFIDGDGGAAETLINRIAPPDRAGEREALLNKLALRMAGDFLFSYQLLRDGAPGFPGEGSIEFGIQQNVRQTLTDLARELANQRMVALGEAQVASAQPVLARAIHRIMMDRRPTKSAPRVHVWPRVANVDDGSMGGGSRADSGAATGEDVKAPPQKVELIISVVADPDSFPPPYKVDSLEFIPVRQGDGVHLSVRVTIRDSRGRIVGEPVEKGLGVVEVDEQPAVLASPVVTACALAEDAPDVFEAAEAVDYCDWSVNKILEYDRVALFVTPHRDLGGPDRKADEFSWRLTNPAGNDLYFGFWADSGRFVDDRIPVEFGVPTPFAKPGSPGRFVVFPDLWGPLNPRFANSRQETGPGAYAVESADVVLVDDGILGQVAGHYEPEGEWQTEGNFEVAPAPSLNFKSFVMEPAAETLLNRRGAFNGGWQGSMAVAKVEVTGSTASLKLGGSWMFWRDSLAGTRQVFDSTLHKTSGRLTLTFPPTVAPGRDTVFTIATQLENLETGIGLREIPVAISYELGLMLPTSGSAPNRALFRGEEAPTPWLSQWSSELDLAGGQRVTSAGVLKTTDPVVASHEGRITFTVGQPNPSEMRYDGKFGAPSRSLPWHLRDDDAIWVIPVITHVAQPPEDGRSRLDLGTVVGYAIYGTQPGPYTGPLPKGPPAAVAEATPPGLADPTAIADPTSEVVAAGGDSATKVSPSDSASVAKVQPIDDPPGLPGGAAEPASEIGVVPPVAGKTIAEAQTALRERGLEPSFVAGSVAPTPAQSRTVESVSPSVGTAAGEDKRVEVTVFTDYVDLSAVPSVTGMTLGEVAGRLAAEGLEMEPVIGDPAPSAARSRTVQRQEPAPNAQVERGSIVKVWVHTDFIALAAVPRLDGMSVQEAIRRLDQVGLVFEPAVGDPAPTPSRGGTVQRQDPPPNVESEAGSPVTVWIHSEFVPEPQPAVVREPPARGRRVVGEAERREARPPRDRGPTTPELPAGTTYYWKLTGKIEKREAPPCRSNCAYYARLEIFENQARAYMGSQRSGADYLFEWDDPPQILIPGQIHPVRAAARLTSLRGWNIPATQYINFRTERVERSGRVVGASSWEGMTHRWVVAQGQNEASGAFRLIGPRLDDGYPEFRVIVTMPSWDSRSFDFATYIYERIEVGSSPMEEPTRPQSSRPRPVGRSRLLRLPDAWEFDRDAPVRGSAVLPGRIGHEGSEWLIHLRPDLGEGFVEMAIHQGCCDYLNVTAQWYDRSGGASTEVCEGGWQIRPWRTRTARGQTATISSSERRAVASLTVLGAEDTDMNRFRPLSENIMRQIEVFAAPCS